MITVSLEDIGKMYRNKIWKLHGIPQKVLSDRESQFSSNLMEDLTKALETKQILFMVYYPETNSQTEWINQKVKGFLQHYVNYQQDNWTEWLLVAEFQYNNERYVAIGYTLFELNFGRHSWKRNLIIKTELPKLEYFLKELQGRWEVAKKLWRNNSKRKGGIHKDWRLKTTCSWKPKISNWINPQRS